MATLSIATAPPDSPVPAPRARNGTPCAAQAFTIAATSAVVSGKATASGSARSRVWPSHS